LVLVDADKASLSMPLEGVPMNQARPPTRKVGALVTARPRLRRIVVNLQRWLVVVVATILLLPAVAFAQKKGPGKPPVKPPPASGGGAIELDEKPAAPPPTQPGAGGNIELDQPQEQPQTAPGQPEPQQGGICEIDPSACPKQVDLKAAATKPVSAELYAVQQKYFLRARRFELNPFWAFSLNDQFVSHPGPGLSANYYITDVFAVGLHGTFYGGLNVDSDFNFQNRRATRVAVPLNEYLFEASGNFTYVPMYGKFAGFSEFIFHYDLYLTGGVGGIWTKPIPVIDPDNRKFDHEFRLAFNLGIGLRIALNRWIAPTLEIRDILYAEKIEALTVAPTQAQQQDRNTWLENSSRLTNHFQAQLGISIFLPFSWEYRLPK
jgi:outer membrane beta-barrel protein